MPKRRYILFVVFGSTRNYFYVYYARTPREDKKYMCVYSFNKYFRTKFNILTIWKKKKMHTQKNSFIKIYLKIMRAFNERKKFYNFYKTYKQHVGLYVYICIHCTRFSFAQYNNLHKILSNKCHINCRFYTMVYYIRSNDLRWAILWLYYYLIYQFHSSEQYIYIKIIFKCSIHMDIITNECIHLSRGLKYIRYPNITRQDDYYDELFLVLCKYLY